MNILESMMSSNNSLFYITDEYRNRMLKHFNTYNYIDIVHQSVDHQNKLFFTTEEKKNFYIFLFGQIRRYPRKKKHLFENIFSDKS